MAIGTVRVAGQGRTGFISGLGKRARTLFRPVIYSGCGVAGVSVGAQPKVGVGQRLSALWGNVLARVGVSRAAASTDSAGGLVEHGGLAAFGMAPILGYELGYGDNVVVDPNQPWTLVGPLLVASILGAAFIWGMMSRRNDARRAASEPVQVRTGEPPVEKSDH